MVPPRRSTLRFGHRTREPLESAEMRLPPLLALVGGKLFDSVDASLSSEGHRGVATRLAGAVVDKPAAPGVQQRFAPGDGVVKAVGLAVAIRVGLRHRMGGLVEDEEALCRRLLFGRLLA